MIECPKCHELKVVKNGHHLGRQRYRCKLCGFQFTRTTPRGHPDNEKAAAVTLRALGLSFNAIAGIFKVSAQTVMRWVRSSGGQAG